MYDYTKLTFTELVAKIGKSRFFHLPKMLEEILGRLVPQAPKYKVYTALLSQSGTDAPVATVLENTLGDIVWSYDALGTYTGTLLDAFTENKTYQTIGIVSDGDYSTVNYGNFYRTSLNSVGITTLNIVSQEIGDNYLNNAPIEIRVYN